MIRQESSSQKNAAEGQQTAGWQRRNPFSKEITFKEQQTIEAVSTGDINIRAICFSGTVEDIKSREGGFPITVGRNSGSQTTWLHAPV